MEPEIIAALIGAAVSVVIAILSLVQQSRLRRRTETFELNLEQRQETFERAQAENSQAHEKALQQTEHELRNVQAVLDNLRLRHADAHDQFLQKLVDYARLCREVGLIQQRILQVHTSKERGEMDPDVYEKRNAELVRGAEPANRQARKIEDELGELEKTIRSVAGEEVAANYVQARHEVGQLISNPNLHVLQDAAARLASSYHSLSKPLSYRTD